MSLSDFGSIANIISFIIGIIGCFGFCKIYIKKENKNNSIKSFLQFGDNKQEIK